MAIGYFDTLRNTFAVDLSSVNSDRQRFRVPAQNHMHRDFVFSNPGFYVVDFWFQKRSKDGEYSTDYFNVIFAVGEVAIGNICDRETPVETKPAETAPAESTPATTAPATTAPMQDADPTGTAAPTAPQSAEPTSAPTQEPGNSAPAGAQPSASNSAGGAQAAEKPGASLAVTGDEGVPALGLGAAALVAAGLILVAVRRQREVNG